MARPSRIVPIVAVAVVIIVGALLGYFLLTDASTNSPRTKDSSTVGSSATGRTTTGSTPSRGLSTTKAPTRPGLTALPTGSAAAALCADSTSNFGVAQTYVGLAELGVPHAAQACVYQGRVPIAVAQRLDGKTFVAVTKNQRATVINFQSTDRSMRISITTTREVDGRYYVTAVALN